MVWNCVNNEERLTDYLDGLLAAEERAAFETHAELCAGCRKLVAGVRGLVDGMHRLEMVDAPQGLIYRILAETTGKEAKPARAKGFAGFRAFLQPKLALGAIAVIATFGIVLQAAGVDVRKVSSADLNPINVFRVTNRQAHLTYARGMKFVNDLRVVYEIQSRLQAPPAPEAAPTPQRRDQSKRPMGSDNQQPLKNFYVQSGESAMTASLICSLPMGTNRGANR
jgi:hypothetical protein